MHASAHVLVNLYTIVYALSLYVYVRMHVYHRLLSSRATVVTQCTQLLMAILMLSKRPRGLAPGALRFAEYCTDAYQYIYHSTVHQCVLCRLAERMQHILSYASCAVCIPHHCALLL
jgi:hypothetical protein